MLKKKTSDFFFKNCRACSFLNTDNGTKAMWAELEKAGYVKESRAMNLFGHRFCYAVTSKGNDAIEAEEMRKSKATLDTFFGGGG